MRRVQVRRNPRTGQLQGFGHVEFVDEAEVEEAILSMNGTELGAHHHGAPGLHPHLGVPAAAGGDCDDRGAGGVGGGEGGLLR